ncbi:MAG: hypothetical protein ABR861_08225 [Terriglobales bacterium]|jgi:hypothetical protein
MKYQACVLELPHTCRCLGTFDSEEKAQTALDRTQYFRARTNLLLVSVIDVIECEEVPEGCSATE